MNRGLSWLVATLLLAVAACAGSGESFDSPGSDKADDLIGRQLSISPSDHVVVMEADNVYLAEALVEVPGENQLRITTTDLRLAPGADVGVRIDAEVAANLGQGFLIEYRLEGSKDWVRAAANGGVEGFAWYSVNFVERDENSVSLYGAAVRLDDALFGTTARPSASTSEAHIQGVVAEYRFLAVPLWNFFDWDEAVYEIELQAVRD